jgi:hypothetical protein
MTDYTRQEISTLLQERARCVSFKKVDGEVRHMNCSLSLADLPVAPVVEAATVPKQPRKVNEAVLPVFDTGKKSWRSFRIASVFDVQDTRDE